MREWERTRKITLSKLTVSKVDIDIITGRIRITMFPGDNNNIYNMSTSRRLTLDEVVSCLGIE